MHYVKDLSISIAYCVSFCIACMRQKSANEWNRNTVKDLLLASSTEYRQPKAWKTSHCRARWYRDALKFQLPKYRMRKKAQYRNTVKPQCPGLLIYFSLLVIPFVVKMFWHNKLRLFFIQKLHETTDLVLRILQLQRYTFIEHLPASLGIVSLVDNQPNLSFEWFVTFIRLSKWYFKKTNYTAIDDVGLFLMQQLVQCLLNFTNCNKPSSNGDGDHC